MHPSLQAGTGATAARGESRDFSPQVPHMAWSHFEVPCSGEGPPGQSQLGLLCGGALSFFAWLSTVACRILSSCYSAQPRAGFEPSVSAAYQSGKGQHCHFHRRKGLARTGSSGGDHIITIWIRTFFVQDKY